MKTQNVHGGGTTLRVDRLASTKSRAALALVVSLWIATGGVASAEENPIIVTGEVDYVYNGETGGTRPFNLDSKPSGDKTGYTTIIDGGKVNSEAWGGVAYEKDAQDKGDASYNTVTIKNKGKANDVYGGYSVKGNATNNHVTLTDSDADQVYGGYTGLPNPLNNAEGDASYNEVRLTRSVAGFVAGGNCFYGTGKKATYNKVYLTDSTVNGNVFGGYNEENADKVTGNELHLSGANTVKYRASTASGKVQNFETIHIVEAKWGTPVLTFSPKIYPDGSYDNPQGITQNADNSWATIDASNIAFSGVDALKQGQTTTLIKGGMTNYQGTIKSGKYKIGTTLEGTGTASKQNADLIYTIDTGAGMTAREQTHNTVMGASVSMTALSMGNEFVGAATEGLAAPANVGADGVSSFAQMGGGSMRQETGSHVDTHTWNAILALGHQNKKERGTMEYGAFFEYGTGNYTTHADNGLRGDGSARYTGGGLLAKYTMKNSVYVEGSLRAGSVHDDARNVLSDGFGNPYSYDTNAAYMGFHLGVGREIAVAGGNAVDVYGKYFYNRRNGVSFDAGGHYDLDAVTSSVLRVGARYILKRNKWNFYAGAAYEHEFDGKANGTADGVAIRGADTSGGSFRGEIGATVKPGENSPWNIDLNVSGFAGKKQGFTGGVSVALMF
ncbi:MAG: autotransporter outer membrane beta-barrel domain-containing protein [Schwartzia succinivorans]|nr:autotransporter outer membrane beta-barrel domain-containing protein [Schwartzia succinivorans]